MVATLARPLLLTLACALALPAHAQTVASDQPGAGSGAVRGRPDVVSDPDLAAATAVEQAQPKRGSVAVGGRTVAYTATPGTVTIRNDEGEPIASMFYTSYVADRARGSAERPVMFIFNGGPGSSTMWLHMGSIGPMKVRVPGTSVEKGPPFRLTPNADTILDRSDLVFIDAIGTGLSRPIGKAKGADFWGVDQDIDAFARGIIRWLTINDRWNSPKFLFGESYGTLRASGLVYTLAERGVQTNGVVLLSSILNYGVRQPGYDRIHLSYIPSYAATAWYHNRVPNRPAALEPWLSEVRAWTSGPYASALEKGDALPDAERQQIAQQMSAYTGLPVQVILDNNLRVGLNAFRKELLRGSRRTVGRLDSRFTGIDVSAGGDSPEFDATDVAITGPYVAALNHYLFGTLGYKTDLHYRPNFYSQIGGGRWDQKHRAPGAQGNGGTMALAATALDLSAAMRRNPGLKVLSANGYYDMATPFAGAEYDLNHLGLEPELRGNISYRYYESGHMIYTHEESAQKFRNDLIAFIDSATRP
jgi:carboxypeptidase C (cathepsin A)